MSEFGTLQFKTLLGIRPVTHSILSTKLQATEPSVSYRQYKYSLIVIIHSLPPIQDEFISDINVLCHTN
jgi:hypothetical protein